MLLLETLHDSSANILRQVFISAKQRTRGSDLHAQQRMLLQHDTYLASCTIALSCALHMQAAHTYAAAACQQSYSRIRLTCCLQLCHSLCFTIASTKVCLLPSVTAMWAPCSINSISDPGSFSGPLVVNDRPRECALGSDSKLKQLWCT